MDQQTQYLQELQDRLWWHFSARKTKAIVEDQREYLETTLAVGHPASHPRAGLGTPQEVAEALVKEEGRVTLFAPKRLDLAFGILIGLIALYLAFGVTTTQAAVMPGLFPVFIALTCLRPYVRDRSMAVPLPRAAGWKLFTLVAGTLASAGLIAFVGQRLLAAANGSLFSATLMGSIAVCLVLGQAISAGGLVFAYLTALSKGLYFTFAAVNATLFAFGCSLQIILRNLASVEGLTANLQQAAQQCLIGLLTAFAFGLLRYLAERRLPWMSK